MTWSADGVDGPIIGLAELHRVAGIADAALPTWEVASTRGQHQHAIGWCGNAETRCPLANDLQGQVGGLNLNRHGVLAQVEQAGDRHPFRATGEAKQWLWQAIEKPNG